MKYQAGDFVMCNYKGPWADQVTNSIHEGPELDDTCFVLTSEPRMIHGATFYYITVVGFSACLWEGHFRPPSSAERFLWSLQNTMVARPNQGSVLHDFEKSAASKLQTLLKEKGLEPKSEPDY